MEVVGNSMYTEQNITGRIKENIVLYWAISDSEPHPNPKGKYFYILGYFRFAASPRSWQFLLQLKTLTIDKILLRSPHSTILSLSPTHIKPPLSAVKTRTLLHTKTHTQTQTQTQCKRVVHHHRLAQEAWT